MQQVCSWNTHLLRLLNTIDMIEIWNSARDVNVFHYIVIHPLNLCHLSFLFENIVLLFKVSQGWIRCVNIVSLLSKCFIVFSKWFYLQVGHDPGKEFTDHWWMRAFNDAAKKIKRSDEVWLNKQMWWKINLVFFKFSFGVFFLLYSFFAMSLNFM